MYATFPSTQTLIVESIRAHREHDAAIHSLARPARRARRRWLARSSGR